MKCVSRAGILYPSPQRIDPRFYWPSFLARISLNDRKACCYWTRRYYLLTARKSSIGKSRLTSDVKKNSDGRFLL